MIICVVDNVNCFFVIIVLMGIEFWEFNGDMFFLGWICYFEWLDFSDCVVGFICKFYMQDVKVWQGVMGYCKLVGVIVFILCVSCIWQIKFDGFY